jgi:D-3-phosphoglycerate dehydrogenase / 2-oxoglutarate reductase
MPAPIAADAVLVTSRSFGSGSIDAAGTLREAGLQVVRGDPGHGTAALSEPLATAVGWIAGVGPIGSEHLDMAPRLRVIARYGVGTDSVDLEAAAARDVVVANTPGSNSDAVADHALALLLAAVRHVVAGDRAARAGDWSPRPGRELSALTVGLVGFGRVGRAFAKRLVGGFGSRVLVHDPFVDADTVMGAGCEPAALDELAEQADALSLHLGGGRDVVVDAALLTRMPRHAVLVNTARGDLVDEAALASALSSGALAAAAVDVLAAEPAATSPLFGAPNVIVTPHVAAQTREAVDRMGSMAVEAVLNVLAGKPPASRVA